MKLSTERRRWNKEVPGTGRRYHVVCGCGWTSVTSSRYDRRVDMINHRTDGPWLDRAGIRPEKPPRT